MRSELRPGERLSALADGQLSASELATTLGELAADEEASETWHLYHLVGDVLRSPELANCRHDAAFVERLNQRLLAEAPAGTLALDLESVPTEAVRGAGAEFAHAANDAVYRWKWLAGLATVAAVGVISWYTVAGSPAGLHAPQWAQTPPAPDATTVATGGGAPSSVNQPMIRDPQLDAMLAAHRQLGGGVALQNSSGFLRNATFENPGR